MNICDKIEESVWNLFSPCVQTHQVSVTDSAPLGLQRSAECVIPKIFLNCNSLILFEFNSFASIRRFKEWRKIYLPITKLNKICKQSVYFHPTESTQYHCPRFHIRICEHRGYIFKSAQSDPEFGGFASVSVTSDRIFKLIKMFTSRAFNG